MLRKETTAWAGTQSGQEKSRQTSGAIIAQANDWRNDPRLMKRAAVNAVATLADDLAYLSRHYAGEPFEFLQGLARKHLAAAIEIDNTKPRVA